MADLNSLSVTGRLVRDAEFKKLASGKGLLVASIAVNTGFGDYQKTTFIKLQQWGDNGANIVDYLKKGNLVGATGEMNLNEWQGRDDENHAEIILNVIGGIQMLGKSKANEEEASKDKKPFIAETF